MPLCASTAVHDQGLAAALLVAQGCMRLPSHLGKHPPWRVLWPAGTQIVTEGQDDFEPWEANSGAGACGMIPRHV